MARKSDTLSERRPSPEALLKLAEKQARGRLKVFLGMAPGVGKTYAMLSAARAVKADGVDVVVGLVETHGRADTAAILDGLDVLPRRAVDYRGRTLMEFDVEAAIARHPKLLLVDEFAHTNAPGLMHPKRYQDVEEILRAGIDVWTTLNIQHLESLTDVVEQITGVTVREIVPDSVVDRADEIVVIDLPPDELIQRLKEGKVYLPDDARRAIDRFFKPNNLTALRELALRRTTDRVDEQMLTQLRQQGIEGAWPTAERLLVCVGGDRQSEAVVRAAGRMASASKSEWIAVTVRRIDREISNRASAERAENALRLAERLGASSARLSGTDLAVELLNFARRNNITQIVIGRSSAGVLQRLFGLSLSHELMTRAKGLSVVVVAPGGAPEKRALLKWPSPGQAVTAALTSSLAVACAVLVGAGLERLTPLPNLSMVFLLAVIACALRFGRWAATSAALLSFLAYNFFFIEPRFSFTVAEPYELFGLFMFLVVAMVTGGLAGRLREQANATQERAEATQALFSFSRKLSAAAKLDDVLWLLTNQSAALIKGKALILMQDGGDLAIKCAWPPEDTLSTADWAAARWAEQQREPAGHDTGTMPTATYNFRPMIGSKGGVLAVIGIEPGEGESPLASATDSGLQSLIEQSAIAIERTELVENAAKAETAAEAERLRSSLLSAISHDLRTPLASIVGSVTSLRTLGDRMPADDRADLLAAIEEEADRLTRCVSNLLDMTKLEAGAITARHDPVDIAGVVRSAAARARASFPARTIEVEIEGASLTTRGDATLLEQVVFNLLDNADKYSNAASVTRIRVEPSGGDIAVMVSDEGIGIPLDALEKVFEKFYRVGGNDGRAPGTGLGLAICAGLVKAMGGSIRAESPVSGSKGTRITVSLPAARDARPAQGRSQPPS